MRRHGGTPNLLSVGVAALLASSSSVFAAAPVPLPSGAPTMSAELAAIRVEGAERSQVMAFAAALIDGIGPRLTGSPNLARAAAWARATLQQIGLSNARLEDWGEFGDGWEQVNAWARMTAPDLQPLWLQAAPWSVPTAGPTTAPVAFVDADALTTADLERLKGTLRGKIVLLGAPPRSEPPTQPLSQRLTTEKLRALETGDEGDPTNAIRSTKGRALRLLRTEGVAAIIEPSRASEHGGGTGLIFDDNAANIANEPWNPAKASPIPHAVMMVEHYGRLARLIKAGRSVTMELNLDTRATGGQHGFNVLAELPGSDPKLKTQVVLAGAHLDSWAAGTGATDDGAGVVVAIEAMRLLKAAGVRPRRTIRLALWTGEEQGLLGSAGYAHDHLGGWFAPAEPAQSPLPPWLRPHGDLTRKAEWDSYYVYFGLDAGSGQIRGLYAEHDPAAAALFRSWLTPLKDLGATTVAAGSAQGGDQEAFQALGLPAFAFLQDPLDYETRAHHSNLDTFERLSEADLKQAAIVEALILYSAAQRDERFPVKARSG